MFDTWAFYNRRALRFYWANDTPNTKISHYHIILPFGEIGAWSQQSSSDSERAPEDWAPNNRTSLASLRLTQAEQPLLSDVSSAIECPLMQNFLCSERNWQTLVWTPTTESLGWGPAIFLWMEPDTDLKCMSSEYKAFLRGIQSRDVPLKALGSSEGTLLKWAYKAGTSSIVHLLQSAQCPTAGTEQHTTPLQQKIG